MTIIRVQATKPSGQAVRGSQFPRARAQRPSPTAVKYCSPRSSCGPSRSSCGPSRTKYASKACAPCCDPMDPFGIMPMLNSMARMSTAPAECRPVARGYASYTVARNIAVDVIEKADCFEISADIPGVQKDQIKLIVDQDVLIIEVEKTKATASTSSTSSSSSKTASTAASAQTTPASTSTSTSTTDYTYTAASTAEEEEKSDDEDEGSDEVIGRWTERPQGFARRTLRLPKSADIGSVTAAYENGVLKLSVNKKEESRQQRISIA